MEDASPNAESRYRARLYFDPNSITMANGAAHYAFQGYDAGSTSVLRLEFGFTTANGYQLRVEVLDNTGSWASSAWVDISDAYHIIEIDWQAASSRRAAWWIDEPAQPEPGALVNGSRRVDMVRLGPAEGLDNGSDGTEYFDAFESTRRTHIGIGTALPDVIFADDNRVSDRKPIMRRLRSHLPSPIALRRRQHTVPGETGPARIEVLIPEEGPSIARLGPQGSPAEVLLLESYLEPPPFYITA